MPKTAKPKEMYRGIALYQIERRMRLKPVKAEMDSRYGPGAWGKDEIVEYINAKQKAKSETEQAEQASGQTEIAKRAQIIGRKRSAYLKALTDVTPGDLVMIEQMCEIERQLEELNAPVTGDDTAALLKARASNRIALIGEHRRIQNDLGIGRSQREPDTDKAKVVKDFVQGAAALLKARSLPIHCPACADVSKINQGFIVFHFANNVPYRWVSTCANPKCGQPIIIQGGPGEAQA